jgi:hypothetical protein
VDLSRIVLLGRRAKAETIDTNCGLLFEAADDSSLVPKCAGETIPCKELLGSREWAEDRSAELLSKLVANSPEHKNIRVLELFEEQMMHELVGIFQALRIDSFLRDSGVVSCELRGERNWFDRLLAVREISGTKYRLEYRDGGSASGRTLRREYAGFRRTNWLQIGKLAARRISPVYASWIEARLNKSERVVPGGMWFFGAAYNTTAIGVAYSSALPGLQHVYADPQESGRNLRECGLLGVPLFRFASWNKLPRRSELRAISDSIVSRLKAVPLSGPGQQVRDLYLRSPRFSYLLDRLLPWGALLICAGERMLEEVRPELIVVGNAAFERALLLLALQHGIPTVMLQHGVIHPYYRVLDQPVDHFLARGEFFRDCVGPMLKAKTEVLDIPESKIPKEEISTGKDLVFVTSPVEVEARYDAREVPEILLILLKEASSSKRKLVIRVHPTENVSLYERMVEERLPSLENRPQVSYSQRSPIDDVIKDAAVVVMFHSTLFMKCLAAGVPMVSPGWHDFPFKTRYAEEGVFNFAEDMEDLRSLVQQGVQGKLQCPRQKLGCFVRPTRTDEVARFFNSIREIGRTR